MKQELKPCHCGAEANLMYDDSTQVEMCYVECSKCLMATMQDTYENVINAWNTRPDHSGESAEMVKGETLTTEIDWDQRRYEIAKDCVSATLSRTHIVGGEIKDVVGYSIRVADELIDQLNQLKKQNDEK